MDPLTGIRTLFPQFPVTKEMIQKPTPEFVMQFYNKFITAVEERVSFSLGWYQDNLRPDLDPEEVIFLKMRSLNTFFAIAGLDFMLADICDPNPGRTKQFIRLCVHFLNFYENFFPDLEKVNTKYLEMKENTSKLVEQKEQLKIKKDETAMLNRQLLEDIEKLKKEIVEAKDSKEAYLLKKSNLDMHLEERRKELEKHMRIVDESKRSIPNLEEKEKQLLKESISEEEYKILIESIANLEIEKKSLENDDINMEELLSHQHRILGNLTDCIKALPDSFNTDLVNKEIGMKKEVKELEREINNLCVQSSSLKSTHAHQNKIFSDSKNALVQSNLETLNLKKKINKELENLSDSVIKKKNELQVTLKDCLSENAKSKLEISELENYMERLKEHFTTEYIKVAKAETKVFQTVQKQLED